MESTGNNSCAWAAFTTSSVGQKNKEKRLLTLVFCGNTYNFRNCTPQIPQKIES